MESLNAFFIDEGLSQRERLIKLNQIAIQQMKVLEEVADRWLLKQEKFKEIKSQNIILSILYKTTLSF